MIETRNWRKTNLENETEILTGFPFPSAEYTDSPDDIALLRGDNIVQGKLRWDNAKRWPPSKTENLDSYFLAEDDVVLAMDRPWIEAGLKYARISQSDLPCLLLQRVARLRAKPTLDQKFLKYVIGSRRFTEHVLGVQTGTGIPHISRKQIKQFEFLCPPIDEQKAIAKILSSLDDKIELNRRMNATLEAMARALFKAWFVDFEPVHANVENRPSTSASPEIAKLFPSDFENGIPKEWQKKGLDEIADFLNGIALQRFPPESEDEFLPVIKIAQLRKGNTEGSDKASKCLKPEYIVHDGDVLFSWSGSLEVEIWCGGDGALNQHIFKVTSEKHPKWFYFLWTGFHLADFRETAAHKATTMGHIQRYHLKDAKVSVPSKELLDAADKIIRPLVDRIIVNALESRNLAEIRDFLLPRLISGKIRLDHMSTSSTTRN